MKLDTVVCADFLDIAPTIADSSINLLISDWPYYKVKALDWDCQWSTSEEYLDWIGLVCEQYHRILAPNGSLYAFASPKMAARVELKLEEYFNILSRITWVKPLDNFPYSRIQHTSKWHNYYPWAELVFFCEHYGADSAAKGESGYGAKCDELRGFVFEPLRAYLDGERLRADISQRQVISHLGMTGHDPHFFKSVQWRLPLEQQYELVQELFNQQGRHPAPPYEDYHDAPRSRFERNHSEREYLRAEYDDLRRPFNVTAQDQYTDVWDFPTVKAYPGKHPCEKPPEMWEHIIRVSSRERDVVGDFFCGSGGALAMAYRMGRHYMGGDLLPKWAKRANERVEKAPLEMAQLEMDLT